MDCVIRSADRTLYDGKASRVVARSPHGEFAVMDGHAPILAVLSAGAVRVQSDSQEFILVCKQGTFTSDGDRVTILVERPALLDEIDVAKIRDSLATQKNEGASDRMSPEDVAYFEALCQAKERHG